MEGGYSRMRPSGYYEKGVAGNHDPFSLVCDQIVTNIFRGTFAGDFAGSPVNAVRFTWIHRRLQGPRRGPVGSRTRYPLIGTAWSSFKPDEHQGGRIDAIPQSGRLRSVREYVSQVCIAPAA